MNRIGKELTDMGIVTVIKAYIKLIKTRKIIGRDRVHSELVIHDDHSILMVHLRSLSNDDACSDATPIKRC